MVVSEENVVIEKSSWPSPLPRSSLRVLLSCFNAISSLEWKVERGLKDSDERSMYQIDGFDSIVSLRYR
jgi:hypothetical protein